MTSEVNRVANKCILLVISLFAMSEETPDQVQPAEGQYSEIHTQIDSEMKHDEMDLSDTKVTHVENLFIISYLTKALQDVAIKKASFLQYPLLLVDLPLALAILIVNVERILYVKILGYVLAHISYDVDILKSLVKSHIDGKAEEAQNWQERAFNGIRKILRFAWGVIILLFILPVWPLIWVYNHIVQSLLIATIYYFLMFSNYAFPGGFLVYYLLLATVTFLVSSITVPLIFRLTVYVKALFSLEKKSWDEVNKEARTAFMQFYKKMQGGSAEVVADLKVRYDDEFKAEGGVYYMLLKFLHYLKDKFWKLKEKKIEAVVDKITDKTVEFVDEYYHEKMSYQHTLMTVSPKDLNRTAIALGVTIAFSLSLVFRGSNGEGIIGPLLLSFVDQGISETIWVAHNAGRGYYQDMVESYLILPNFLKYFAMGADYVFYYFFQVYYVVYPLYMAFVFRFYTAYLNFLLTGIFYNYW